MASLKHRETLDLHHFENIVNVQQASAQTIVTTLQQIFETHSKVTIFILLVLFFNNTTQDVETGMLKSAETILIGKVQGTPEEVKFFFLLFFFALP